MKFAALKNRPVISVDSAEKHGAIESVFLDLKEQRVLGFRVRSGGLIGHHEALLLEDVKSVGDDAITISDAGRLNDPAKFTGLRGSAELKAVLGARVMSESGTDLGTVSDIDFDLLNGAIGEYILSGGMLQRLRGQEHFLRAIHVKSVGDKMILAADEAEGTAQPR